MSFRSVSLGLMMAIVGFSVALATRSTPDYADAVQPRALVGSSITRLEFTNPLTADKTQRDLGDAVLGSAVVRYIGARGGIPALKFTAPNPTQLTARNLNLTDEPFRNRGVLSTGTGVLGGTADSFYSFIGSVADSQLPKNNSVKDSFRLSVLSQKVDQFRFALDSVSDAAQNRDYLESFYVINSVGTVTFSVVSVSMAGNTSITNFNQIGLMLQPDGNLIGRPLVSGQLSFVLRAVDSRGSKALSRSGARADQPFNMNIVASNVIANTGVLPKKLKVKFGKPGKQDSLEIQAQASPAGLTADDLKNNTFEFSLGAYDPSTARSANTSTGFHTVSAFMDANGTIKTRATDGQVIGKMSRSGKIRLTTKDAQIKSDLGVANLSLGVQKFLLRIQIAQRVTDYQSIDAQVSRKGSKSSGGARSVARLDDIVSRTSITYPASGSTPKTDAGAFQILTVKGSDDTTNNGDKWVVTSTLYPPASVSVSTISKLRINIASGMEDTFDTSLTLNRVLNYKSSSGTLGTMKSIKIDTGTGKTTMTTNVLPTSITNIVRASTTSTSTTFPITVTFLKSDGTTVFSAQSSAAIKPSGSSWTSNF